MSDYLSEPHAYLRKLPHIQPSNASYFVTYRLAGSIPKTKLVELQIEKENFERELRTFKDIVEMENLRQNFHRYYFKKYDDTLDAIKSGPDWLKDPRLASLVADSIKYFDGIRYKLFAYCVMPNHVHQVFYLNDDHVSKMKNLKDHNTDKFYPVTKILESIKKYTSRRANIILNRKGSFWERESYDHVVRGNQSLVRIVKYVLNNPVKAGLVELPEKWQWNYCKQDLRLDN